LIAVDVNVDAQIREIFINTRSLSEFFSELIYYGIFGFLRNKLRVFEIVGMNGRVNHKSLTGIEVFTPIDALNTFVQTLVVKRSELVNGF